MFSACCSVLQRVAVRSVLHGVLQCIAVCCSTQCVAGRVAVCCSALQCSDDSNTNSSCKVHTSTSVLHSAPSMLQCGAVRVAVWCSACCSVVQCVLQYGAVRVVV